MRFAPLLCLLFLIGCPSTNDAPTWHQDVAPIFATSCDGCHRPGGGGTPVWDSPEQVAEWAPAIAAQVQTKRMPPWTADDDCREYEGDFSLSEDEIATVLAWVEGDAPLGDAETAAPLPEPFVAPSLERTDITIPMPVDYTPRAAPDDYRCFLMEWPYTEDVWVTGYEVVPGNINIAHHAISFLIAPGDADAYRALDAADPEPGYTCYGGPGGDINTLIDTAWLGSWAPGSGALTTPPGTGLEVEAGSLVVMQMHYYVSSSEPQSDRSALAFQVETEPQRWAEITPWTEVAWLFGAGMEIPPQTEGITHSFTYTLDDDEGPWSLYAAAMHMHKLGRRIRVTIDKADGSEECVVSDSSWDFDWQRFYRMTEPAVLDAGDTLRLECTWDNPGDAMVQWGDGTGDEMCLGITLMAE